MSHNLDEHDEFTATVPTPDLSDRTYPFTVPQALQALTNRSFFNYNTETGNYGAQRDVVGPQDVAGTFGGIVIPPQTRLGPENPWLWAFRQVMHNFVSTRRMVHGLESPGNGVLTGTTLNVPIVSRYLIDGTDTEAGAWEQRYSSATAGIPVWRQHTVENGGPATSHPLVWQVVGLPPAGNITKVSMMCRGNVTINPSGHTALPQYMPRMQLLRVTETTPEVLFTQVDGSTTKAEYEAFHRVETTTFSTSVVPYAKYFMIVYGEHGTNAIDDTFKIQHVQFTISE